MEVSDLEANWLGVLTVAVERVQSLAISRAGTPSRSAVLLTLAEFPRLPWSTLPDP
ncbi:MULTISPECIES: hypothetical protein [unclassified Microbacterium]|uniref:hypothetical protein n=1 Tax=unclassified Microbacterium TaxID=2609290 RepID=UPI0015E48483|nr:MULTISPECIES: hypothetical protein [unclassified Microbacterium]